MFALKFDDCRVTALDWKRFDLELDAPFTIAGGSHEHASIELVRVTLADGTVGLGEAAPLPAYNRETIDVVERALARARRRLPDSSGASLDASLQAILDATADSGAARCAIALRCSGLSCSARARPPLSPPRRPSATATGSRSVSRPGARCPGRCSSDGS